MNLFAANSLRWDISFQVPSCLSLQVITVKESQTSKTLSKSVTTFSGGPPDCTVHGISSRQKKTREPHSMAKKGELTYAPNSKWAASSCSKATISGLEIRIVIKSSFLLPRNSHAWNQWNNSAGYNLQVLYRCHHTAQLSAFHSLQNQNDFERWDSDRWWVSEGKEEVFPCDRIIMCNVICNYDFLLGALFTAFQLILNYWMLQTALTSTHRLLPRRLGHTKESLLLKEENADLAKDLLILEKVEKFRANNIIC